MKQLVLAIAVLAACTPTARRDPPLPPVDPTRMSHERHVAIGCTQCHRGGKRPGADDHKPCDDDNCHRAEFLREPSKFCEACHLPFDGGTKRLDAGLKPYPVEAVWQAQPSKFSHKAHLDSEAMEAQVGFHVTCVDCHTRGDVDLVRPDHAVCQRCHAAEAGLAKAPPMERCLACHEPTQRLRVRQRLITGDLHPLDHVRHRTDRKGQTIKCDECHVQTANATEYRDHVPPRVESCVGCHDDADRTPDVMRMRICETCHSARTSSLASIAPRSHLPLTERPLDHTIAFRRDHAESAERDAKRCAACHTQMSGNPKQACDECHQTMEPQDHRITWRELDHGTEAAADRERCARCHVVEFCTSCHQQRPRSHGFAGTFYSDHGRLARIDIRPCVTCHSQSYCITCHQGTIQRSVR